MNVSGSVEPHSDPQLGSNTVGPKISVAGAASIAGFRPVPSSATATDGLNGSSDEIVSVAVRSPPADGLNRTLMFTALPAPSVNGSDGAPTTAKSAAFAPLIASPVTWRSQNAHDAWFEIVVVNVFVDGFVRLSTATPPYSRCVELTLMLPVTPVPLAGIRSTGWNWSSLLTWNVAVRSPGLVGENAIV